jgi:hypothetical protein
VFKQTVLLKSRAYYEFILQGCVLGNNINVFAPDVDGSFAGAIVGDPLLNSNTGIEIFGKPSKYVYDNVIDMDFSAMYPHIIITFNIERNTMIGKLIIYGFDDDRYEHMFINSESIDIDADDDEDEEDSLASPYDAGKDYMDNVLCGDILSIGTKWHNLPNFDEINRLFKEKHGIRKKTRFSISKILKKFSDSIIVE